MPLPRLLLVFLLIWLLLWGGLNDQVLVIQLVIPGSWLPYLDWLAAFPGFNGAEPSPGPPEQPHYPDSYL